MLTLKTVNGKHIITYNGVSREYRSLSEALKVIAIVRKYFK